MKQSEFFGKFKSWYLWGNLLAMFMVVLAVGIGVRYGLDVYTHHGESIEIPNVKHRQFADAEQILKNAGLKIEVVDTGYVKSLPPTITLPDVIDNSSLREAMAKLSAMGFKLGMPQYIAGEKDWVYGILVKGRHVVAGDRISVEETLIIQVGNGLRDGEDSVDYIDPVSSDYGDDEGDIDEFEEVTESETSKGDSE